MTEQNVANAEAVDVPLEVVAVARLQVDCLLSRARLLWHRGTMHRARVLRCGINTIASSRLGCGCSAATKDRFQTVWTFICSC